MAWKSVSSVESLDCRLVGEWVWLGESSRFKTELKLRIDDDLVNFFMPLNIFLRFAGTLNSGSCVCDGETSSEPGDWLMVNIRIPLCKEDVDNS